MVVTYYNALSRHDAAAADVLLDPGLRAAGENEAGNIARLSGLRDLRVAPASYFSGLPTGYSDITQVFVTYDVVYKQEIASANGANSRFLYLGRNAAGEWRILSIGTGP